VNKERLFPYTALTDWYLIPRRSVYCAVRTGSLYIIQVMCFAWIWKQTAIISLYSINWLVCITETECVYCPVRTGSLYIVQVIFVLKVITLSVSHRTVSNDAAVNWERFGSSRPCFLYLSVRTLSQNTGIFGNDANKPNWRCGSRQEEHIEFGERLVISAACRRGHWKLQNTCNSWRILPLGLWSPAI
jgi:hypothetical protein